MIRSYHSLKKGTPKVRESSIPQTMQVKYLALLPKQNIYNATRIRVQRKENKESMYLRKVNKWYLHKLAGQCHSEYSILSWFYSYFFVTANKYQIAESRTSSPCFQFSLYNFHRTSLEPTIFLQTFSFLKMLRIKHILEHAEFVWKGSFPSRVFSKRDTESLTFAKDG